MRDHVKLKFIIDILINKISTQLWTELKKNVKNKSEWVGMYVIWFHGAQLATMIMRALTIVDDRLRRST